MNTAEEAVPSSGLQDAATTSLLGFAEDGAGMLRAEASPFKPRGAGRRVHVERWVKGRLRETTARSSGTQILRVKLKSASLTSGVDCC